MYRYFLLAHCYVVAKVYKVLYYNMYVLHPLLVGSHPYVYYYTVPKGKGKGKHSYSSIIEGQQHVYCIQGNNRLDNSYWPIPHFVCSVETVIPRALPSGLVLLYCLHTNLRNKHTVTCTSSLTQYLAVWLLSVYCIFYPCNPLTDRWWGVL